MVYIYTVPKLIWFSTTKKQACHGWSRYNYVYPAFVYKFTCFYLHLHVYISGPDAMDRFSCICSNRAMLGFCAEIQILFLVKFMFARKLLHCGKKTGQLVYCMCSWRIFGTSGGKLVPRGGERTVILESANCCHKTFQQSFLKSQIFRERRWRHH